jgi:DNA polymerase III subunit epsilon
VLLAPSRGVVKHLLLIRRGSVGGRRGTDDAHAAFERWAGRSPLLAFHAAFDRTMIEQAMKAEGHRTLNNRWLDLEPVAAVLHPGLGARALDDWLGHFGIACAVRHQAAADTLATAELLLRLWPAARRQHCASFAGLSALARQQRWLQRSRKAAKRSASRSG